MRLSTLRHCLAGLLVARVATCVASAQPVPPNAEITTAAIAAGDTLPSSGNAPSDADDDAAGEMRRSAAAMWIRAIWGHTPEPGVSYHPVGIHSNSLEVEPFHLRAISVASVMAGPFRNSFGDRTWAFGIERTVVDTGSVSVQWWFGGMAGYHGRLIGSRGIPLSRSWLFRHNVNPVFGVPIRFRLADHLQLDIFANPIASAVGVRMPFGTAAARAHRAQGSAD